MVWKASYGPVPLARALKGSGAMPLPPKNIVSDFSLYNKKNAAQRGGCTPLNPSPGSASADILNLFWCMAFNINRTSIWHCSCLY